eukprot:2676431-Pleurochrysis_carterae.AAC.1
METNETVEIAPAVSEASTLASSPASAEQMLEAKDTGLCAGYDLADKYPPLRHFATSVPINHYR